MRVHLNGCEDLRNEIERIVGVGKIRCLQSITLSGQRLSADGPKEEAYTNVEGEVFNFMLDPILEITFLQPQHDLSLLLALHSDHFTELLGVPELFETIYAGEPTPVEVLP